MSSSISMRMLLLQKKQHHHQHYRHLSTTASSLTKDKNKKISIALYRQLLRWCKSHTEKEEGKEIPLGKIPPLTLQPPLLNAQALSQLAGAKDKLSLLSLPRNSIVDSSKLVAPISVPSDVKAVLRSVFAINKQQQQQDGDDANAMKEQIKLGFDALKSLNELNVALDARKEKRMRNLKLLRSDLEQQHFMVGQVVQHKLERYRAVVIGYNYNNKDNADDPASPDSSDKATSLTQKNYALSTDDTDTISSNSSSSIPKQSIKYELLLDSGDAHLLGRTNRRDMLRKTMSTDGLYNVNEFPTATHDELELVSDPCLCRIRNNWTSSNFTKYNTQTNRFEPNHILQYEHPRNQDEKENKNIIKDENQEKTEFIAQQVTQGIQQMAKELNVHLTDSILKLSNSSILLSNLQEKLSSIASGKILSPEQQLEYSALTPSSSSSDSLSNATLHLKAFLHLTLHHTSLCNKRFSSLQHKHSITYPLGTIIKHVKYNYRGVIIGWDAKPQTNVRNWDGVKDIENVMNKPFYHVVPDANDCRKIFGGERSLKYVCQDNLTECMESERGRLDVDLDPNDWPCLEETDDSLSYYEPSEELKFQFAEPLGEDEDIIVSCMEKVMRGLTALHVLILEKDLSIDNRNEINEDIYNADEKNNDQDSINKISSNLSMSNLFHLLQYAENLDDGIVVEETIKELWKVHPNTTLRYKLDDGISLLLNGNTRDALDVFSSLVVNDEKNKGGGDETYFEAWNKKSTCHYMLGENDKSLEAAQMTLKYQPRHFQARNGIGLIQYENGDYEVAVESFREALRLDPWSPVSTRYSSCLDRAVEMGKQKGETNEKDDRMKDETHE